MMAANVVQHKTRSRRSRPRARLVEPPRMCGRARASASACARSHTREVPRAVTCTYIEMYLCMSMYVAATYTRRPKTSPLTPFTVVYRGSPVLSLLASSYPFLPFFPAPRLLLFPRIRPVTACETIHLSSRSLVHGNGKTWDRVGNNVPGKKPRREKRIFSGCLPPRPSLSLARSLGVEFRRSTLHVFAGKKDSAGVSFLAGYRRTTGDGSGKGRRKREKGGRERGREMERNDNPFGGHNAEPGTVKLTRQEIRPTNRPLSLHFPSSLSLSLFVSFRSPPSVSRLLLALLPRGELTPLRLYANRHRFLRASHKLTELYYADPLPLCPPRLSSPLCSRDAPHSFIFFPSLLFSFL